MPLPPLAHRSPRPFPYRAPRPVPIGLAFAFVLGTLAGCGGETTLATFDVDEDLPKTRVMGASVVAVLPAVFPPLALDVKSNDVYEGESVKGVTAIEVQRLVLIVDDLSEDASADRFEDGMPDDLSFLRRIDLFIEAEIDGATRRELVASVPENDPRLDAGARRVALDTSRIDILPFVEAEGGYTVQIEAKGTPPPDDVVFGGEITYDVGLGFR